MTGKARPTDIRADFSNLTHDQKVAIAEKVLFGPLRAKRAFFESPEFETLMEKFHVAVKGGVIDQEDLKYCKTPGPFTADEFQKAFEAVMECAPGAEREERTETGNFPVLTKTYRGLDFKVLLGQGSTYFISETAAPAPQNNVATPEIKP